VALIVGAKLTGILYSKIILFYLLPQDPQPGFKLAIRLIIGSIRLSFIGDMDEVVGRAIFPLLIDKFNLLVGFI